MTSETFFEKFDQLADTPNGVKKMRELVLQLAVQGGLVPHSAAEPAVPYASVEDAAPINVSDVPENWRVALLADAIKNRSGNSKLIKGKLHEEPAAGRFQGFSASGADVWCDDYEHEGAAIIISAVGARCGKSFKASGKWSAIANTNITRPEPSLFDFDFAYLVLNNEHFWVRGGSAQPFVKFPPSLDRHFALPPLAEQKRIVAKVDELMALCDRLAAQQQERETRHAALARASLARFADAPTPANLHHLFHPSYTIPPADLRKSILTLAVQGKLVPQDPNDEPADVTFPKLAAAAIEADEDGFPAHWLRVPLGKTGEWRGGGTPSKTNPDFWKGDLPWVSPKDMKVLRISDAQDHISKAAVEGSSVRLIPPGSLLMVVRGMILARAFPVALTMREVTINQDMKALLPCEPTTKEYLLVALRAFEPDVLAAIEHSSHGTCKLKTDFLHDFVMPLPPLAEQRRIVAKVDQLMALVDELGTQLAASRATAANLLSALVAELTTQE